MIKRFSFSLRGFALVALALAAPALAADNYVVKDATGATITIRSKDTGGGVQAGAHTIADTTGTLVDPATKALQQSTLTALGSPFQAGGSIGNTAFGISGTLPAFAATPTFNLGTAPVLSTLSASPAVGAAGFTAGQATITGTSGAPTLVVAARTGAAGTGRVSVSILNESTTVIRFCATSTCTAGIMLPGTAGASITLSTTAAIYGFVPSGSAAVSFTETF